MVPCSRTKVKYLYAGIWPFFLSVLVVVNVSRLRIFAAWARNHVLAFYTPSTVVQVVKYQYLAITLIALDRQIPVADFKGHGRRS
ncbi:MAG TPA: hypothetical protein VFD48_01025 [Pyrinomonadaceae bacterium]|nr:hypothetical protein [Pyrinomonadaceae bacterium]